MRAVLAVTFLFLASSAHASPFAIHVLDASYRTTVMTSGLDEIGLPTITRHVTSTSPTSDGLEIPASVGHAFFGTWADAAADTFAVNVSTGAFTDVGARSLAEAITTILFQPVTTGIADLTLEAFADQRAISFSDVTARLTDITTSAVLWAFTWDSYHQTADQPGDVELPWDRTLDGLAQTALIPLATPFAADHLYQLTLSTWTSANIDREVIRLGVSGMKTVPEPTTLVLLLTAGAAAAYRRRRHHRSAL